jgi:hypothetical protein
MEETTASITVQHYLVDKIKEDKIGEMEMMK